MTDQTPPTRRKRCTGPCGRMLPVGAQHFPAAEHVSGHFASSCRDCEAARAAYQAAARVKAAAHEACERSAWSELNSAADALDELLTKLAGGRPPLPVTFQTTEGRRNFIRNHIATAPPGHAAEAAANARRIMAAAGEAADRDAAIPDLGPLAAIFERRELGEVP
jgi:hypothetical protein